MNRSEAFVKALVKLNESENRAALARLKRTASGESKYDFDALPVIGRFLPPEAKKSDIENYMLLASLFAHHPKNSDIHSFGKALYILRKEFNAGAESLDKRFARLLNAVREDLDFQLRQLHSLVASKDIGINYSEMLKSLKYWDNSDKFIQKKWAHDYWITPKETNTESS